MMLMGDCLCYVLGVDFNSNGLDLYSALSYTVLYILMVAEISD